MHCIRAHAQPKPDYETELIFVTFVLIFVEIWFLFPFLVNIRYLMGRYGEGMSTTLMTLGFASSVANHLLQN